MTILRRVLFICFLCIMLSGCKKENIIMDTSPGNTISNSYILSAEKKYNEGNYYSALNDYLKVEDTYSTLNNSDNNELLHLYNKMGRCYIQLLDYSNANDCFEKSLLISEKLSDERMSFDNYIYLMEINYSAENANLEVALEYGRKAEKLAIDLYGNQSAEIGEVYGDLGNVYIGMAEYDIAEDYMQKSLNIMKQLYGENNDEIGVIYKDLADMYESQEQYLESIEYLEKAEEIFKINNNVYWLTVVYGKLGNINYDKKDYSTALAFYNKSLDLCNRGGKIDYDLAKYHYGKAGALYNLKDYEEGKKELVIAHSICEKLPIKSEFTELLINRVKEDLEIYYEHNYKGDKSMGFEAWYKELISTQAVQ